MLTRSIAAFVLAGLLYALAVMLSLFNEYFDRSEAHFERATVIEKGERLMPFPVRVLALQSDAGGRYSIDVMTELSERISVGDKLDVAVSHGWLGKSWRMDKDLYFQLHGSRMRPIQSFIYVAIASIASVYWFRLARQIQLSERHAALSLLPAYLIAYAIFWLLP